MKRCVGIALLSCIGRVKVALPGELASPAASSKVGTIVGPEAWGLRACVAVQRPSGKSRERSFFKEDRVVATKITDYSLF